MSSIAIKSPFDEPKPKKKWLLKVFWAILIALLICFGFRVGYLYGAKDTQSDIINGTGSVTSKNSLPAYLNKDLDFKLFWDVWQMVRADFVDKTIPETKLLYGAMSGVVDSLGDPYSVFLEPKIAQEFADDLKGSFEGIGAEIGIKNNTLTVIAPLSESPAEKAGLRAGDKILMIDKTDTAGISLDYAVSIIRGAKGTKVKLTILSKDDKEPREVEITRASIIVKSVSWEMKDKIAHIKLMKFNEDTPEAFAKIATEVLAKNPRGIILDMRNNPGGYLTGAINIASYWASGVIVQEKSSERLNGDYKDLIQKYDSTSQPYLKDIKTIILVNGGSASASEIVAGALQDYKKAQLVGEKTFGKGSVQTLKELPDGSSLKLTIAKWLTPNGRAIDGEGIEPDVKVELTKEDYNNDKDPQLDKAIELIKL